MDGGSERQGSPGELSEKVYVQALLCLPSRETAYINGLESNIDQM